MKERIRRDKGVSLADLHDRALAEPQGRAQEGATRLLNWLDREASCGAMPKEAGEKAGAERARPPAAAVRAKAVFDEAVPWWRAPLRGVAFGACAAAAALVGHALLRGPRAQRPEPTGLGTKATRSARVPSAWKDMPGVADPCLEATSAAGDSPLVDDFEDGNELVALVEARNGYWVMITDTDLPASEPVLLPSLRPGAGPANRYALHVSGGRRSTWGASAQVDFGPTCYDASIYRGIAFDVRGPGRVFAGVRTVDAVPLDRGGSCISDCYESHVHAVDAGASWTHQVLLWSELRQRGKPDSVNSRRLSGLEFVVRPEDTPYDLWIDNVAFVR